MNIQFNVNPKVIICLFLEVCTMKNAQLSELEMKKKIGGWFHKGTVDASTCDLWNVEDPRESIR
ncbi:MAG: hypothetical protein CVV64_20830 [Candidatus Wallbacteria bacterium HGW-Wallbacteria-1]|jgi:hypothetical protein|uniref:Uncharacterized protein n=1 Tax=Candidatus Wallbacteria bacterium HGW-Wallbacteria-1 TaxID=2013854 RepID=A0A2N1PHZ3_9BACT|nr:MAG: hypothetical protein CVV64_20830 [Candidatus Wallbacteria bacterium HGW-Wallbacteria-1]PKL27057.1 MAG: hypothetical protein CVV46_13600 [Spirochaetae bacterium HGW-Spirochaetae-2]